MASAETASQPLHETLISREPGFFCVASVRDGDNIPIKSGLDFEIADFIRPPGHPAPRRNYEGVVSVLCSRFLSAVVLTLLIPDPRCENKADGIVRAWHSLCRAEQMLFLAENPYWYNNCRHLSSLWEYLGSEWYSEQWENSIQPKDSYETDDEDMEWQMHTDDKIPDQIYSPHWQLTIMNITKFIENKSRYKFKRLELLMVYLAARHKVAYDKEGGPVAWARLMERLWCRFRPQEKDLFEKELNWSVRISHLVLMWKIKWPAGCRFAMERWQRQVTAIENTDAIYPNDPLPLLNGRRNPNGLEAKVEQLLFSWLRARHIYNLPAGWKQPFFRRSARTMRVLWDRLSREQQKSFFKTVPGWKECLEGMALYSRIDGEMEAWTREWLQHMVVVRKRSRPNPEEWEWDQAPMELSLNIG
ncbi:hypothetical protein EDC01DRAFT_261514 [Geopyxis carbonaria]|nr:hypothetical protein EDC01DRAFT_261514 [Geopyxis carbonaria]